MDATQARNLRVIAQHSNLFDKFKFGKILLLSPNWHDYDFWKNLLPNARFTISTIRDWNIKYNFENSKLSQHLKYEKQLQNKLFDLTIAQNVFMYLDEPIGVIQNISKVSDNLFIQDLKYRKRSNVAPYFGKDGDIARYSTIDSDNLIQPTFNFAQYFSSNILFSREYRGSPNNFHTNQKPPIHILIMMELASRLNYAKFSNSYSIFAVLRLRSFHIIKTLKMCIFRVNENLKTHHRG